MPRAKKPKVACTYCGYENRARAVYCNLCKEPIPKRRADAAKTPRPVLSDVDVPPVSSESSAPPTKEVLSAPPPPMPDAMAFAGQEQVTGAEEAVNIPIHRSTFYEEKGENIRNSNLLMIGLFFVLVAIGAAIGGIYGVPYEGAGAALVVAIFMALFSWFSGSSLILSMSGAKKIEHGDHPQLFNVCEEMKIASGIPMPDVYIIDSPAPNAFATGRSPDKAAVAVTKGLLEKLNRDELQGVIAHEFGHIRNFDIRYAMLAGILVGSIALISDAFLRGGLRSGGRSSGGGGGAMVIIAILLAILAPISAYMLQMAISRRREFLADATAVELTRNPDGLANALKKITADPEPLSSSNRATQHLYIVNPVKNFKMNSKSLFSTHPATKARLHALRQMGAKV